jgi:hypothetical protein
LRRSEEEPSVWLPLEAELLEVNYIGMQTRGEPAETYVLEDSELPLLVFAHLSLLRPGKPLDIEGLAVPVPRPAGLLLEPRVQMPDPTSHRALLARLMARLEKVEQER